MRREKLRSDQIAQDAIDAANREAEAAARAQREAEAKLTRERERIAAVERERVEQERVTREAEARARAEAAAAPDREKLIALARDIRALHIPDLTTARGKQIGVNVTGRLKTIAGLLEEAAKTIAETLTDEATQ